MKLSTIAIAAAAVGLSAGAFYASGIAFPGSALDAAEASRFMPEAAAAGTATQSASTRQKAPRSVGKPTVVEFFTTQSCSSCPPADKVAAKLKDDPNLVVISRAVTYWDRLGWTDTLGRQANTDLQRAYARRTLDGRNGVYTPQAVVNGRSGVVGHRERELRGLIADARPASADIDVQANEAGGYTVTLSGKAGGSANVTLVALDRTETVQVGRGENRGRTLTYHNVLRGEERLGSWNGGSKAFTVGADRMKVPGANRYAVIVQDGTAGPILGGSYLS